MRASKRERRSDRIKDIATLGAGAAIGGGLGYLLSRKALLANREILTKLSPIERIKLFGPAATFTLGGAAMASALRNRAKDKRRQMLKESMYRRRPNEISYYR